MTFVTAHKQPGGGELRRATTTLIDVPTLLRVDAGAGPDLLATVVLLSTSRVTLVIDRLPGASAALPASVEAVARDPTGGSLGRQRIAVGYDARGGRAPRRFRATVLFRVGGDPNHIAVQQAAGGAADGLVTTASLFDPGAGGARLREERIGVGFAPVPSSIRADVTFASPRIDARRHDIAAVGRDDRRLARTTATTSAPCAPSSTGSRPRSACPTARTPTAGRRSPTTPSTRSARSARASSIAPAARLREAVDAAIADLPGRLRFALTGASSGMLQASAPVGQIDVAAARNGEPLAVAGSEPGVRVYARGDFASFAVRLRGLQEARVDAAGAIAVDADDRRAAVRGGDRRGRPARRRDDRGPAAAREPARGRARAARSTTTGTARRSARSRCAHGGASAAACARSPRRSRACRRGARALHPRSRAPDALRVRRVAPARRDRRRRHERQGAAARRTRPRRPLPARRARRLRRARTRVGPAPRRVRRAAERARPAQRVDPAHEPAADRRRRAHAGDGSARDPLVVKGRLTGLPGAMRLRVEGRRGLHAAYDASAPLGAIHLSAARRRAADARAQRAPRRARPAAPAAHRPGATRRRAQASADRPVGSLSVATAPRGEARPVAGSGSGLRIAGSSLAARLRGLRRVVVRTASPLRLDATLARQRFAVTVDQPTRGVLLTRHDRPACRRASALVVDLPRGVVAYDGHGHRSTASRSRLTARRALFARARRIGLTIASFPSGARVRLDRRCGSFRFDASRPLGTVDVSATDGTPLPRAGGATASTTATSPAPTRCTPG